MRTLVIVAALALPAGAALAETPVARRAAEASVAALQQRSAAVRAAWQPGAVTPARLTGLRVPTVGATPEARARGFLRAHPDLLALREAVLVSTRKSRERTVVRLQQTHAGRPVVDRVVAITLDGEGAVRSVINATAPLQQVKPSALDAAAARALAVRHVLGRDDADLPTKVSPVVFALGTQGVEGFEVELSRVPFHEHLVVRVDGHAGEIIGVRDEVMH